MSDNGGKEASYPLFRGPSTAPASADPVGADNLEVDATMGDDDGGNAGVGEPQEGEEERRPGLLARFFGVRDDDGTEAYERYDEELDDRYDEPTDPDQTAEGVAYSEVAGDDVEGDAVEGDFYDDDGSVADGEYHEDSGRPGLLVRLFGGHEEYEPEPGDDERYVEGDDQAGDYRAEVPYDDAMDAADTLSGTRVDADEAEAGSAEAGLPVDGGPLDDPDGASRPGLLVRLFGAGEDDAHEQGAETQPASAETVEVGTDPDDPAGEPTDRNQPGLLTRLLRGRSEPIASDRQDVAVGVDGTPALVDPVRDSAAAESSAAVQGSDEIVDDQVPVLTGATAVVAGGAARSADADGEIATPDDQTDVAPDDQVDAAPDDRADTAEPAGGSTAVQVPDVVAEHQLPVLTGATAVHPESRTAAEGRRKLTTRDLVLAACLLLVVVLTAVLVRSALHEPSRTPAAGRVTKSIPTLPPGAPRTGSYAESRITANGDLRVRQWVRSASPLDAVRLEMPVFPDAQRAPSATDVVVISDQALLNQPATVGSIGQRLFFDAPPKVVYLSYTLKGAVVMSPSAPGRALARATSMQIESSPFVGPSRVTLVSDHVLSMACSGSLVSSPRPCGMPGKGRWSVWLTGKNRLDTVLAQVDLKQ